MHGWTSRCQHQLSPPASLTPQLAHQEKDFARKNGSPPACSKELHPTLDRKPEGHKQTDAKGGHVVNMKYILLLNTAATGHHVDEQTITLASPYNQRLRWQSASFAARFPFMPKSYVS